MSSLNPYKAPAPKPADKTSLQLALEAQAVKNKAAAKKKTTKTTDKK